MAGGRKVLLPNPNTQGLSHPTIPPSCVSSTVRYPKQPQPVWAEPGGGTCGTFGAGLRRVRGGAIGVGIAYVDVPSSQQVSI